MTHSPAAVPALTIQPASPVSWAILSSLIIPVNLIVMTKTVAPVPPLTTVILATRGITTMLVIVMSVLIPCPAVMLAPAAIPVLPVILGTSWMMMTTPAQPVRVLSQAVTSAPVPILVLLVMKATLSSLTTLASSTVLTLSVIPARPSTTAPPATLAFTPTLATVRPVTLNQKAVQPVMVQPATALPVWMGII
jgi:hypothetical protein